MEIRTLVDADLEAVERLLLPTEARSLFLLGNARQHGIGDRGGPLNGCWIGAFQGAELVGVVAWFRGFGSLIPAAEGYAAALVPALLGRIDRPRVVIGAAERVAEALAHIPWPVQQRRLDRLLVLRWSDYRPRRLDGVRAIAPSEVSAAADAIGAMHREVGSPTDAATNLASAQRLAAAGNIRSIWCDAQLRAISMEGAATGRYVQVGATWCAPEARRKGFAGACVSDVLDRARAGGRARKGAALFTGRENEKAIRLYQRLGFRQDAAWETAFLEP